MTRMSNKTRTILEWILMLGGWFFFEWQYVEVLEVTNRYLLKDHFPMIWSIMAIVEIILSQSWKRKGNWILYAGFALVVVRCMFTPEESQNVCFKVVTNSIWAMGVCYHLGSALSKKNLIRFIKVLIAGWTIQQTIASVAGIYCTLYDKTILNMAGHKLIWFDGRLSLLTFCTIAASNLVVSFFAAMLGVSMTKNIFARILYIVSMLIMFVAIALTSTRTAFISIGAGLGMFFIGWLMRKVGHKEGNGQYRLRRLIIRGSVIAGALAIVVVICIVMMQGGTLFNEGKSTVMDSEGVPVLKRSFSLTSNLLSGREAIWECGIKMLQDNPRYLLYGASFGDHMIKEANSYYVLGNDVPFIHFHNIYLQALVECGIGGLLLLLGFIIYFAKAAISLYANKQWSAWKCMLPIIPAVAFLADMVECMALLQYNHVVLPFMMLFMGVTIRVAAEQQEFAEII
ncbi:MAG: O-antigen ligase family protein [Clostridia bacterium]|nr:O-antigen ligase family protein [Clostridia bacterium]